MPKGQKTRERIVAEAASLFNQRGFEGGSISELMEATGLEKGGIYGHFSSKEELAAVAFDYAGGSVSVRPPAAESRALVAAQSHLQRYLETEVRQK